MPRLLNRQTPIPNGFQYYSPQLNFRSRPWSSISIIALEVQQARLANPEITKNNNWSTDIKDITEEVDYYNALIAEKMGWTKYYVSDGGQTVPFHQTPVQQSVRLAQSLQNVAAGGKVLVEWIESKEEAVPVSVAEERAAICVDCPKNDKGDWTRFFTVPAANAIKNKLEIKRGWNLRTSKDDQLKVCTACDCPMALKVWTPLERVKAGLTASAKSKLDPRCWILK